MFPLSERAGRRLKACLGGVPLVRPGAAPERGTVVPPLWEMKCVSKDANAGGTAEGLPFVPTYWDERLFCFLFWRHTMVSRRIRFLFSVLTAVVLIIGLCAGDGALSGNGQALPILMYHDVVEDGQPCNTWTVTAGRLREDLPGTWRRDLSPRGSRCSLPLTTAMRATTAWPSLF